MKNLIAILWNSLRIVKKTVKTMINWRTQNLTIIDETNIFKIIELDKNNPPVHTVNYYELIETPFVWGRLLYEKTGKILMYWFAEEEIGNINIKIYNGNLTWHRRLDIILDFYREQCIEKGNTLSVYVPENLTEVCNYLKKFGPQTKLQNPYIIFKFFTNHQQDWFDQELYVIQKGP